MHVEVVNASPSAFSDLDHDELRRFRDRVARCDLRITYAAPDVAEAGIAEKPLEGQWDEYVSDDAHGFKPDQITEFCRAGHERLREARAALKTALDATPISIDEPDAVATAN